MARIIDYSIVLERMKGMGLVCNYYNSGSFGFPKSTVTHIAGWIGGDDSTIRAEMKPHVRHIAAPFEQTLAGMATRVWLELIGGSIWVMPASHWAFELDFGSRGWMPALVQRIGIDAGELQHRTDGSAIEFSVDEIAPFSEFLVGLLTNLTGSDFVLAFPGQPIVCSVHHHKQLWWVTSDETLGSKISEVANA